MKTFAPIGCRGISEGQIKTFRGGKGRLMPSPFLRNREGYILFSLLIVGFLGVCIAMSTFVGIKGSLKTAGTNRINSTAFNIAEAGKEHALSMLRSDSVTLHPNAGIVLLNDIPFDIGAYTVRCSTNSGLDTVYLQSRGKAAAESVMIAVSCWRYTVIGKMNYASQAAVTAKADVELLGNIIIDGNDYDSINNIKNPPGGTYAVITCGLYTSRSKIRAYGKGITDTSSIYVLDSARKQNADTTGYPRTPEEVLGLHGGDLDSFKISAFPAVPFHGIVYIDSAGPKIDFDFKNSTGIFIYHNSTFSATLKNIKGSFKGILICDRIDHVNDTSRILGAIVTLSKDPAGNCFGNGDARIRYSSQILSNLKNYCGRLPLFVDIASWREL
jgi:hypothetical protein